MHQHERREYVTMMPLEGGEVDIGGANVSNLPIKRSTLYFCNRTMIFAPEP